jgi:hypothetical protein
MIRGLQITIQGSELSDRIAERIRMLEATIGALDSRIEQRAGEQFFDVRAEDGFKTLGELEAEQLQYRDRVCCLSLLRDNVAREEIYALDKRDLRLAELISSDAAAASESSDDTDVLHDRGLNVPIDRLKLTMPGVEVRQLLEQRIDEHRRRADWWKREQARTPEQQTEDEPLLPDHMCANEAECHEWRADVLSFLHDHIEFGAVYQLSETDLAFAELLPAKPSWLEDEYEERSASGFNRSGSRKLAR